MVARVQAVSERLKRLLREFFLLQKAKDAAWPRSPVQAEEIRRYKRAAQQRVRVAADLVEPSLVPVAMTLYREALLYLLAAMLVSVRDEAIGSDPGGDKLLSRVRTLASEGRIERLPNGLDEAAQILAKAGPFSFDRMAPEVLANQRSRAQAALASTGGCIDDRTHAEIRLASLLRLAVGGFLLVCLLAWGVSLVGRPPNVALHKPVTASSRHPASVAPPDNSAVVDGKTDGAYGVHTLKEARPFVMIDLQHEYSIRKIKVYNRGDGWFDEVLPLGLELSSNGTDFVEVDRRTTSFSQTFPWVYSAGGRRARYVRLHGGPSGYIALSEIEVYGK